MGSSDPSASIVVMFFEQLMIMFDLERHAGQFVFGGGGVTEHSGNFC